MMWSCTSRRSTLATCTCTLGAKRTMLAVWSGSGTGRLAAHTYASPEEGRACSSDQALQVTAAAAVSVTPCHLVLSVVVEHQMTCSHQESAALPALLPLTFNQTLDNPLNNIANFEQPSHARHRKLQLEALFNTTSRQRTHASGWQHRLPRAPSSATPYWRCCCLDWTWFGASPWQRRSRR